MSQQPSFISELRRRKVFRVAAAYAVAAFAVLQAVDLAVGPLRLPAWTMTLLWVLALAGFPVSLALAWALQLTPEGVRRDEGPEGAGGPRTQASHGVTAVDGVAAQPSRPAIARRSRRALWLALGIALAASGTWLAAARLHHEPALDRGVVAVLPFRVAAADPSLSYLREGMLDLLAAKLTGEGGPRAVEPRTLLAAWRAAGGSGTDDLSENASLALARGLGAGGLLEGTVVGTATHLTLSASLLDAGSRRTLARASVEGPPDSLSALVDRLAGQLLAGRAGEDERHLAALTATPPPLPALKAYLEGNVAYRRGAYQAALREYNRALELDSTFALAALQQLLAGNWVVDQSTAALVRPAWSLRERLSARDRALLEAIAGPSGSNAGGPRPPSYADELAAAQHAVELSPDRPEAWNALGEVEFHEGRYLGHEDATRRADAALSRAFDLDSSYAVPLMHLVELSIREGHLSRARALADRFEAINPDGDVIPFIRWRLALAMHDTATLARLRADFPTTSIQSLLRIIGTAELEAAGLEDARAAASAALARAGTPAEQRAVRRAAATLEQALGHPARAAVVLAGGDATEPKEVDAFSSVSRALISNGSPTAADSAVNRLWPLVAGPPPTGREALQRWAAIRTACELWRIRRGTSSTAAETTVLLRTAGERSAWSAVTEMLAEAVDASAAVARHAPDSRARVERLDRTLAAGHVAGPVRELNLVAAGLWDALGAPARALAAVRRRAYEAEGAEYQADYLREEGRLAALTGDRRGAIDAYRHYLALRTDPEPSVAPEVEQVRRALARLVAE